MKQKNKQTKQNKIKENKNKQTNKYAPNGTNPELSLNDNNLISFHIKNNNNNNNNNFFYIKLKRPKW